MKELWRKGVGINGGESGSIKEHVDIFTQVKNTSGYIQPIPPLHKALYPSNMLDIRMF